MAAKETRNDPSNPSAAYKEMAPKWAMIDAVLGGTSAMREAGEVFLPRHPAEDHKDYSDRLASSVLYNVTELTLSSLVGRVFREEIVLNDDVPDKIKALEQNIDLEGTTFSSFCTLWFADALAKGFSHVYIDMPAIKSEDRATRTLADDAVENRRPFWSLIKPENLIFAHFSRVDGKDVLMQARIVEIETALDGFDEVQKLQIRVLEPGKWALWEDTNQGKKNAKPNWTKVDEGQSDLPIIPLLTFYTDKKGHMCSKPPLEDLVHLNIRHWQSYSDQINVLTVGRFPMLASSGAQIEAGKAAQPIGPRQLLSMRDPQGRFYYVEHSGKAISSGQQDLDKLEDQMSAYGAEFLRRQIAGRTAFERAQDTGEAISLLKQMALNFKKIVEQGLSITGQWLGIEADKTGTITINTDYTEEDDFDPSSLNALEKGRVRFDVSRETWLNEMVRRGVLSPTLVVKDEIERITKEMAEGPHPPSFFTGQEQIQGSAASPATVDSVDNGDGTTTHSITVDSKKPATAKQTNKAAKK